MVAICISYDCSKIFELLHPFKEFVTSLHVAVVSSTLLTRYDPIAVLSCLSIWLHVPTAVENKNEKGVSDVIFDILTALSDLLRTVAHDVAQCNSVKPGNVSEEVSNVILMVDHGY